MRTLAAAIVVSFAGLHCGAPVGAAAASSDDEEVSEEAVAERRQRPPSPEPPSEVQEDERRYTMTVKGTRSSLIKSTARGDDDSIYATGTFSGTLIVGDVTLRSRGEDDVFIVRFDPKGSVAWTRAVGSTAMEREPHVTFEGGKMHLVAQTVGEVDCGSGGMAVWSSPMFFFCVYSVEGEPLGGGSFPTGSP